MLADEWRWTIFYEAQRLDIVDVDHSSIDISRWSCWMKSF